MKLKSYFDPSRNSKLVQTVQIRMAEDDAPSSPFVLLGELNHEPGDNASGMQKQCISHAIYSHVQEQVYLKQGIQDMQRISITHAGTFALPTG